MTRLRDWVGQLSAAWTWSEWRPGRRRMNQAFRLGIETRRRFNALSEQEQAAEMLKSLQAIVRHARSSVPFYSNLMRDLPSDFPASFADYRKLTPLDKTAIRSEQDRLLSALWPENQLIHDATGGSTGEPVVIYSSPEDLGWKLSGQQYYQSLLGCPHGSRIATLYGGELDVTATPSRQARLKNWLSNYSPHGCFRLDEPYLMEVHRAFSRFQPDMIVAYASAVHLLAITLEQNNQHPTYPRKVIVTGAEKLESHQRAAVERVFSVPVVERYGSRDVSMMAYQIPGHGNDFWVDRCYCLIEPDGSPDEHGQAPILVTTLLEGDRQIDHLALRSSGAKVIDDK